MPVFVAFGLDADGKPRAARFDQPEAHLAIKAATFLCYRVASIADRSISEMLPVGDVFARGNGLMPHVSRLIIGAG